MDKTDDLLISALRENSRLSLTELGRQLKLSRTTIQERISKLERSGVIAGYTVRLGREQESREIRAHVMLKIEPRSQDSIVVACRKVKGIIALHTISGEFDLSALLRTQTTEALDASIDEIGMLKGVERTQTSVILSTKFEKGH